MSPLRISIALILLVTTVTAHSPRDPVSQILLKIARNGDVKEKFLSGIGATGKEMSTLHRQRTYVNVVQSEICESCVEVIDLVMVLVDLGLEYADVRDLIINTCYEVLAEEGLRTDIICPGFLDNNAQRIVDILAVRYAGGEEICLDLNLCDPVSTASTELGVAPAPSAHRKYTKAAENSIKVVHLTDVHVETKYLDGSATDCGLPVCCRPEGDTNNGTAGLWGDYNCNTPPRTVELILRTIADLEPDFILYSGDHPVHAIWDETQESQMDVSRYITQMMADNLPGVSVFPTIGNHEMFPTNLYYMGIPETIEFNNIFGEIWTPLAGFESGQISSINRGGFYHKSIRPGLRLLAYNSNFGYTFNFYNLVPQSRQDLNLMIEFIRGVLNAARDNNEKVVILTHHPSNLRDTYIAYSQTITDLLVEYSDLIVLHVMGHTHNDEFAIVTDGNNEAVTVQLTSPAVTPWEDVNPSFRLYHLDPESFLLQDYDQYRMNLAIADDGTEPAIEKVYRASEEYAMADLSPSSFQDLITRFQADDSLYNKYLANRFTREDYECNDECRRTELCFLRYSTFQRARDCLYEEGIPQV